MDDSLGIDVKPSSNNPLKDFKCHVFRNFFIFFNQAVQVSLFAVFSDYVRVVFSLAHFDQFKHIRVVKFL